MALARLRSKILGRRSVRARIALACTGLFLVIAAAFVAAIYTVVDRSFGSSPPPTPSRPRLARTCQAAEANGTLKLDHALATQCHTSSELPISALMTFTNYSCGPSQVWPSPPSLPASWGG